MLSDFWTFSSLIAEKWYLSVILIFIAPIVSEVEHHFYILRVLSVFYPILSVHILQSFFFWIFGLLLIGVYEFFYLLGRLALSSDPNYKYFPQLIILHVVFLPCSIFYIV